MSKIYVIHENDDWTQHLTRRLQEIGAPFEMWHLDEGHVDLSSSPPAGVFYSRISASSHTRGHRFAPEYTEGVLAWLERHGRRVVNGTRALRLEVSKVNQYMALDEAGVRTPETISAVGRQHILDAARALGRARFITKHNRAGKGQGVSLFDSVDSLEVYLDSDQYEAPIDGITLIQEYIEAPTPSIVRHEFIGGKFFYAVRVDTSDGFELCPADHCAIDESTGAQPEDAEKFRIIDDYSAELVDKYEYFLERNNILVAGIEAIEDGAGRHYTYDVNTNTNYNSDAEKKVARFGMLELAGYLHSLLLASANAH